MRQSKILSEEIDGNSAELSVRTEFGNGEYVEEDWELVRIEDRWTITGGSLTAMMPRKGWPVLLASSLALTVLAGCSDRAVTNSSAWSDGTVSSAASYRAPRADSVALYALYDATDGDNWTRNAGWLSARAFNRWYGVETYRGTDNDVRRLRLFGNNLTGPLPSELGSLAELQHLDLDLNYLSGPIPSELGALRSLTYLGLGRNGLSGPIPPELGALRSLTYLGLGPNGFSGPIPPELGALHSLEHLDLRGSGVSGPIPPELGALRSLKRLELHHNDLSGPIPARTRRSAQP